MSSFITSNPLIDSVAAADAELVVHCSSMEAIAQYLLTRYNIFCQQLNANIFFNFNFFSSGVPI